ncbi:RNI-like protein [Venustampulla echinocandica]|uniref:RNI-like protein n=1 Tax=Venustampulla echinocandica TaxID=2656787 RepID=A0A370TJ13_9HELO|nr:RNI-like protein [Venustampulla echinocandica]RDL35345.1 RNI-like protein [Venustampulla echinocandica]
MFSVGPSVSLDAGRDGSMSPVQSGVLDSPRIRPRGLHKVRPTSLFGSLGKRSMADVDEDAVHKLASSTPGSPREGRYTPDLGTSPYKAILYHGEVQTASGMFRKKKEYLVLTETHLIRFKSQSRASDVFPSIPPTFGRTGSRHPSSASVGSLQDAQSNHSHASTEGDNRIPLSQIVTTYRVEDGRPFFTTEVVYLDEDYHGVGCIQLMLYDPTEADLWLSSIRGAAHKARLLQGEPYPERVVRYLAQILEGLHDYDPDHFQIFRVARRPPAPKPGRSSSFDDLHKLGGVVFYMVIGINCLHLIPVPDFTSSTGRLLPPNVKRQMYGIVTLYQMNMQDGDDRFELTFRMPLQPIQVLDFASFASSDIVVGINKNWQYLRPLWLDRSFLLPALKDQSRFEDVAVPSGQDEYGAFDRTLVAHCVAYNCNPANIMYGIDWEVEDSPEFQLYAPAMSPKYSVYELLAIMRSLRYNNSFHSISFKNIDLQSMHSITDDYGTDHVAYTTRHNIPAIGRPNIIPQTQSILYREIQALALKSSSVRRMDLSNTLPTRRPNDMFDVEGQEVNKDPGCEIVAALLSLCAAQLTRVSWIVLNGIKLGETDLDEMIPALKQRRSGIRAIECSRCGLSDRGILQLLGHLEKQNATLECINISDNSGRIDLDRFSSSMGRFSRIRKLDLSRITRTSGNQPLFAPEVLLSWKLEELIMSGIPANEMTVDSIATYLASDRSDSLRVLQMDQCGLTGNHVAFLMRAMAGTPGEARELQLHVSANKLEKGMREIVKAIKENHTPAHLVLRMIEFEKEDHFRRLLEALRTNTTMRSLDISKASLPYDANPETCDALRLLFAENTTLEDLDISGERAHLEVARFGIGLNHALTGLKQNKTLKVLRIEYQDLGLEGANTLSSVLEENTGLTHIHCEHNDINLQGFTILVNALAKNYAVLEFPFMHNEQDASMKRLGNSLRDTRRTATTKVKQERNVASSVRRTLSKLGVSKAQTQDITPQDLDAVMKVLADRWDTEMQRMSKFLARNRNIAAGIDEDDPDVNEETMRPTTALSDNGILQAVLKTTTPKADLPNPVDDHVNKGMLNLSISSNPTPGGAEGKGTIGASQVDGGESAPYAEDGNLADFPAIAYGRLMELDSGAEIFKMGL